MTRRFSSSMLPPLPAIAAVAERFFDSVCEFALEEGSVVVVLRATPVETARYRGYDCDIVWPSGVVVTSWFYDEDLFACLRFL